MYKLEITPEDAGWGFCGLRILELGEAAFETGEDELIVLPLEGGAEVTVDGERFTLEGRGGVWDGPTDFVYVAARRARGDQRRRARGAALVACVEPARAACTWAPTPSPSSSVARGK